MSLLSTGQATRRFTHPLRTALLYGISIYYFDIIPIIFKELEISRFLRTFLKSSQVKKKKKKKNREFLQFRGGLIPDSIIVDSRRILNNYYNSIITIIISIHFTCKPSSLNFLVLNNNCNNRNPLFSTSILPNLPILGNFFLN